MADAILEEPSVAVNVAGVLAATTEVLTVNVVESWPAGTVTLAGTVALDVEDFSAIVAPARGAGPLNFKTPVVVKPPDTSIGLIVNFTRVSAVSATVAFKLWPLEAAVRTTLVFVLTTFPVIGKVAVVPEVINTDAGMETAALPAERVTVMPTAGAGLVKVTVPVVNPPAAIDAAAIVKLFNFGGSMVSVAI
jgi:hypothetical protein